MKIAVVGAGIFGVTIALGLDAIGCNVHLYDKQSDILTSASRANQCRLHMGYHYPRSISTMKSCLEGLKSFELVYGGATFNEVNQLYCVANDCSKTDKDTYLKVLEDQNLEYKINNHYSHINYAHISLVIEVPEKMFNYFVLKGICLEKLSHSKVELHLGTEFKCSMMDEFDQVVVATYSDNNDFCLVQKQYQFELVEKLILYVPDIPAHLGTIILDGAFCCLDPFPDMRGLFLMGHVDHAIHSRNTGTCYFIPTMQNSVMGYYELLNQGIIPAHMLYGKTRALRMIEGGRKFFNYTPTHIGSMFTYRVVLPNADETDERPSIVERVNEKVITVLGGKIPTVVDTTKQVIEELCQL